ncbi:MAG: hypothetical protein OXB98_07485 [Bryobacterales bacterium]|nr:hypothetical protein [Bryobacterales bacterium]
MLTRADRIAAPERKRRQAADRFVRRRDRERFDLFPNQEKADGNPG